MADSKIAADSDLFNTLGHNRTLLCLPECGETIVCQNNESRRAR